MKSRWRKMLFANFVAWPVLCPHCGSRNIGRHPTIIAGCFNPGDYGVLCGDCGWEGTRLGLRWTWLQRVVRWINHVLRLDRIPPLRSFLNSVRFVRLIFSLIFLLSTASCTIISR